MLLNEIFSVFIPTSSHLSSKWSFIRAPHFPHYPHIIHTHTHTCHFYSFLSGHLLLLPFILFKPSLSGHPFPRSHLGSQPSREQITPGMSNGIESVSSQWVANLNLAQVSNDWNSSPCGRKICSSVTPKTMGLCLVWMIDALSVIVIYQQSTPY